MFTNVLIAEDHESANISVQKTLKDLDISRYSHAYYCDDALSKIQRGLRNGEPYDLLITDISFEDDGSRQELKDGAGLINAVRQLQPGLKILVFSAESRATIIDSFFTDLGINGYVRKARNDAQELKTAIGNLAVNRQHYPAHLRLAVKQKNAYDFTDFDITIITQLSRGMLQKDIPAYLQQKNISPSGLSSVEKRLYLMKEALQFSKNEQLVAFCKDIGVI